MQCKCKCSQYCTICMARNHQHSEERNTITWSLYHEWDLLLSSTSMLDVGTSSRALLDDDVSVLPAMAAVLHQEMLMYPWPRQPLLFSHSPSSSQRTLIHLIITEAWNSQCQYRSTRLKVWTSHTVSIHSAISVAGLVLAQVRQYCNLINPVTLYPIIQRSILSFHTIDPSVRVLATEVSGR